jgi:ABC-type multidrug transport system permease subunit
MSDTRSPRPNDVKALFELTRARVLEFVREPEAIFWVFIFPVLLALVLGLAFREKPAEKARVAVVSGPRAASEVHRRLSGASGVDALLLGSEEAAEALRRGKVDVVMDAASTLPDEPFAVKYRFDPSRAEATAARLAVDDALQRSLGRADLARTGDAPVTAPGSRYIDFLIPGLIGLNIMGSGMWGIGYALVEARTRRLLKRFAATPMRRSHYLLSYGLSRMVFLVFEVAALIVFGALVFDVEVRGSILALALFAVLGAAAFGGLGLLIAARTRTTEGVSGLMNLVQLPMWLLSGTFFSYERFPDAAHPAIRALPLTALNDGLRATVNGWAPLSGLWVELAVLALWTALSFGLALRLFRWK